MRQTFRQWMNEKEGTETEYQKFFKKKCEEYGVKSPLELTAEDKKKFFSEIEKEWTGDEEDVKKSKEESEKSDEKEVNESKPTWDDAEKATKKVADLFKGHSKITSKNSLTIEVDGITGKIVFDPSF